MGKVDDCVLKLWSISPQKVYHFLGKNLIMPDKELKKIGNMPRYTKGSTNILGEQICFVDSASFLFMYEEIFVKQIYKFLSDNLAPYIIDCGANIGLSVIYFKQLYPNARITAFEPDPNIFQVLARNIEVLNLKDIELVPKGVASDEGMHTFYIEGADGGRIISKVNGEQNATRQITTTSLKRYLNQPVDFLKIDIEGQETEVLVDCKDLLKHVRNIFVEYHSFIGQKQTLGLLLNVLTDAGFRFHLDVPGLHSQQPFVSVASENGMDLQLNVYGLNENGFVKHSCQDNTLKVLNEWNDQFTQN